MVNTPEWSKEENVYRQICYQNLEYILMEGNFQWLKITDLYQKVVKLDHCFKELFLD